MSIPMAWGTTRISQKMMTASSLSPRVSRVRVRKRVRKRVRLVRNKG